MNGFALEGRRYRRSCHALVRRRPRRDSGNNFGQRTGAESFDDQPKSHDVFNGSLLLERPTAILTFRACGPHDTYTPLERPQRFAGKAFFDAAEQATFEAAVLDGIRQLLGEEDLKTSGDVQFTEFGKLIADRRTALIVDPPNGGLPALSPAAREPMNDSIERKRRHVADGPEDFDIWERCICSAPE